MRDSVLDQLKSFGRMRKERNKTCSVPKCCNPLTPMTGPGCDSLCREHQIKLVEYGGMGKLDRIHTLHREWQCDVCGWNPMEDPRLVGIDDLTERMRIARMLIHGDHKTPKAQGGGDEKDNITSCCIVCHAIKTAQDKDYLGKRKIKN